MRILHTADWHLGHTLHGHSRAYEHERFLAWLLEALQRHRVDALLIAGDIFHTSNPSAEATRSFYRFLAEAVTSNPHLQVVVVAGNHDSPARLAAPQPIFDSFRIHVVGTLRDEAGCIDMDRVLVGLRDRSGQVQALCAAIPFLRPSDLPVLQAEDGVDPLIEGVRQVHEEIFDAARQRLTAGQALVSMGHAYMVGGRLSELSERKVLGGNQHALPLDIYPADVAYVALGHLHLAQAVDEEVGRVRYSGSPMPLSLAEVDYRHEVTLVDIKAGQLERTVSVRVPRVVDLVRVPQEDALPLEAVLERLAALPAVEDFEDPATRPYLEVAVQLDRPVPDLRHRVMQALRGRGPRLTRLSVVRTGSGLGLGASRRHQRLQELSPEQVFRSLYTRHHAGEPDAELLAAFHELVDEVGQGDA